eukprot:CAMPEP_0206555072 /NCGR_PEP_ID=MMETSP0325_2-20121206/17564_1 /ASSEMBLY_ACC=CAM_ASM_000347 /TAXON_ID=2866 /ORGANISM="Crypthecodinium cohnii, Strain Seligo" /LENGTH=84 /DNA_ID=CAMNT_0054055279 /DNA_START=102 /DNA_END=356 /DNA_ORIENTATION=+
MENPSSIVRQYAETSSVTSLWTRINARRGLPFAQQAVHMAKDADYVGDYKLTIFSTKWLTFDNVFWLSFATPIAWILISKRVPK